jgi:hypothetical protein
MSDYFFEMCAARGELAATKALLEVMVKAIESNSPIQIDACVNTAKDQIVAMGSILDRNVYPSITVDREAL